MVDVLKQPDGTTITPGTISATPETKVNGSAVVKHPAAITANRASAASAGAGASMYDSTLKKPIWSDGTVWRDATGTTV